MLSETCTTASQQTPLQSTAWVCMRRFVKTYVPIHWRRLLWRRLKTRIRVLNSSIWITFHQKQIRLAHIFTPTRVKRKETAGSLTCICICQLCTHARTRASYSPTPTPSGPTYVPGCTVAAAWQASGLPADCQREHSRSTT
jgi:hypothetical protein